MKKNDSRYFNTAILFDKALIELLEKKDFEYVTVKEICNKAGVNRSTFYLHYETINDLVEETCVYINDIFIQYFKKDGKKISISVNDDSLENLFLINDKYLIPYLNFIKENKLIFKIALNHPYQMKSLKNYNDLLEHIINPILNRYKINESEKKYLVSFYINGLIGIIKEWLNCDCSDPILEVSEVMKCCVRCDLDLKDYEKDNQS